MGNYTANHTNEDYDNIKNLSDEELVRNYKIAYDLPYEEACEGEMMNRFINLVIARNEKAKKRRRFKWLHRFF
jgi:hypothetical protein